MPGYTVMAHSHSWQRTRISVRGEPCPENGHKDSSPFPCSMNISWQYNCSYRPTKRKSFGSGLKNPYPSPCMWISHYAQWLFYIVAVFGGFGGSSTESSGFGAPTPAAPFGGSSATLTFGAAAPATMAAPAPAFGAPPAQTTTASSTYRIM